MHTVVARANMLSETKIKTTLILAPERFQVNNPIDCRKYEKKIPK
jgi:hypothetical protein